ncbi:MAG: polysaccharide biosynthesis C-terminal domain-containing protein [Sphingobacteriaceae bacterium]|nr:polysaccharide biosynthesis C-terminal domain-containing protein [Sphingobacteriaceae bacterium]
MGSGIKKLAGQTVIYGLGTIVPRFINYFITPILTYSFTPAEYGINSELFAYISFLNVIFTYGMETTFFNFNAKLENKKEVYDTALISVLSSTIIFTLLLMIFSSTIAGGLATPNANYPKQFILWCIFIIASDAIMVVPFAKLRSERKALKFSLLKISNVVINVCLTLFFIVVCKKAYDNNETNFFSTLYNPEIGIGYYFLANLIANIFTVLFLSKSILSINLSLNVALLKEMLRYTWPLLILGLAGMVNETLDRIILKEFMVDKAEAQIAQGIYGACYKIAILMAIFTQAFRYAVEPFIFGKAKEKDSQKSYALIMKYYIIFCLLIFLGTMMNMDWIKYFIDESYRSGLKIVPILLLSYLFLGVVYNLGMGYKLTGQTKFGAIISIFGAIITIVINVIFIPKFSYVACAWATFSSYAGMMLLSYFLGKKYYPIKYNLKAVTVYSVIAIGLYFVSMTYSNLQSVSLRLVLNNLLVILFVWLVYKLEISNIKKIRANASSQNNQQGQTSAT